ncbi:hypothetical protein OSTOST_02880, partial [Ostertagia ostertagi]
MVDAPILKQTLMNCRNTKIMLLVPLTVFNGVEQAFVIGIFTKAFVACGLGVPQIGFVCTAFGISDAICSLVFGPLIKLFGRMPLFVFGAVNNMLMIVTLMIWPLNPADKAILYVAATVWGMADGVWNTQINGLQFFLHESAFVACGLGVPQIGFVCTAFGISDAICSLVFGPLIKLFGRMPLFVFGAVNNMLMIVTLMIWPLNPADKAILYVAATVWGMADGVWNTQINGFWVALAGRQSLDLAFSNYRFWESIGLAAGFAISRLFSVETVLLILFCLLLLGMIGYCAIELYDDV